MIDKFVVTSADALPILDKIVRRKVAAGEVNTASPGMGGNFNMGWDARPDSDFGKYEGHRFRVIVTVPELSDAVRDVLYGALHDPNTQRSQSNG